MNGPYLESSPLSNPVDSEEDTMPGSDMSRLLAALNTVLQMENDDEQRGKYTYSVLRPYPEYLYCYDCYCLSLEPQREQW
jgi:hypothetical protein